jgi:biopolymer transport protein ExbD
MHWNDLRHLAPVQSPVSMYIMGLRRPKLAYLSVATILAALALPQAYWQWLETRTFVALDMPVSLSKGDIRTPDFPINLKGWYHIVVWVDSVSGCQAGLSHPALVSRSTVRSNGKVIESSEGRDRYLGHFYVAKEGHYAVALETISDPTCLNAGHPRIGVWTESNSYVNLYNQLRNAGIVIAFLCLGLFAFSFSSTVGVVTLFAPAVVRMVYPIAPRTSSKMGDVTPESVEFRRHRRLPLKRKFAMLPNRGLIGGPIILLLLILMFILLSPQESRGIYVRLVPRHHSGPDELCLAGPIVVTISQSGSASRFLVNGGEVNKEELEGSLKSKLAQRADWEVLIEGDDSVSFADPMYAIDVINALHAKAVILTPKLKAQMAERGCPLSQPSKTGMAIEKLLPSKAAQNRIALGRPPMLTGCADQRPCGSRPVGSRPLGSRARIVNCAVLTCKKSGQARS